MKHNCTLGRLTCPATLTKLLRAKWKIKLYITIKYCINTIIFCRMKFFLAAQAESRGATLYSAITS